MRVCHYPQRRFLEPYETATKRFKDIIEKEKELVSDNPPQVKVLERIKALRMSQYGRMNIR